MFWILFLILIVIFLAIFIGGDKVINRKVLWQGKFSRNIDYINEIIKRDIEDGLNFDDFKNLPNNENKIKILPKYIKIINDFFMQNNFYIDICQELTETPRPSFVKTGKLDTKDFKAIKINNKGWPLNIDTNTDKNILLLYFPNGNIYLDIIPIFDFNYTEGYRIYVEDDTIVELKNDYKFFWAYGIPPNCPDNEGLIFYSQIF